MTTAPFLPDRCLTVGHSHEVNYVVRKFRDLPFSDQCRLAVGLLTPADLVEFSAAGNELSELFDLQDGKVLTDYMNEVLYDGESVISVYLIWPHERQIKVTVVAHYFREYLSGSLEEGYTIPEITLPHRLVK